jgi:endonuclease/exonuclease/phosphatase family metal-dependent hydrolase
MHRHWKLKNNRIFATFDFSRPLLTVSYEVMNKLPPLFLILLAFFLRLDASAQSTGEQQRFRVMSYNVENFFAFRRDTVTPSTNDPNGYLRSGYARYRDKRNRIAQVIAGVGQWDPPVLVALCEVENQQVLEDLTLHSPLRNLHYQIIHYESPDPRGIDVALLYRPALFHPFHQEPIGIHFPNNPKTRTRDILYVTGTIHQDTLHVFVTHFPSRYAGELESEFNRLYVASVLRHHVDSIFQTNPEANILIMGDFNDYPDNESVESILKANSDTSALRPKALYNLFYSMHQSKKIGSYKHGNEWGMLDQIIVSSHLLTDTMHLHTTPTSGKVYAPDYLLEEDAKGFGKKPFRTFIGMKYHNGFSDHLPVYADFSMPLKSP